MPSPPSGLIDFIDGHDDIAVALDRRTGVLAANTSATAAWPFFRAGQNIARAIFLDPELDDVVEDLPVAIDQTVALLRDGFDNLTGDGRDATDLALIGELMSRSPAFARLWTTAEPLRSTGIVTVADRTAEPHGGHYRYSLTPWPTDPGIRILTWRSTSP